MAETWTGNPFTVWPWERRFIAGTFGQPGNAALSCGRGQGKSAFVAALAAAVVCPGAPLHGTRREVVCVASSFLQSRIIFEDVLSYARGLGHDLSDRELWRRQDSQNMATLEYVKTGARVRCIGSDPKRAHGLRPYLVLADEPAQWESGKAEAMISALRTGLGKTPGSRLIALGTLPADGQHWFSQMLRDAPYHQLHAAAKDAPIFRATTWAKANPSLRYLPSLKAQIKTEAAAARRDGVMLQSFKSLRLNMGLADVVAGVLLEAGTWASIEGDADRNGEYVLGLDLGGSTAQSAAAAWWPKSGRLEGFAVFPENPPLATRASNDGAGNLYSECHRRGELLLAGEMVADIRELLTEALDRWGSPAAIAADRFKKAELIGHLNALDFPEADLVLWGMGWRDGSEDVRQFQLAALAGHLVPVKSLLMRASMSEARLLGDVAGNWKLAKGSEGGTQAAGEATYEFVVSELKPTRNAVHGVYSIEDHARVPGLSDAIMRDMRAGIVEKVDRTIFRGDATANEPTADIAGLETLTIGEETIKQSDKVKADKTLEVEARTEATAQVYTDEARVYYGLNRPHEAVKHSAKEYVHGMAHTNGMESHWAMLKRGYVGVYHQMSVKHLPRYVAEFEGRHNSRPMDTAEQMCIMARGANGKRMTYAELTA